MPAGSTHVCKIIRFSYPADDAVGGAVPSGTVVYDRVDIRIKAEKPTQALVEQGLQTPEIFSALIFAGNLDLQNNDQIQITAPATGWYYLKKFRIIGIQRSSNNDWNDRNQIRLTLRRYDEAHANDYQ